jgi:transcriptional regulator with XRE-family HTH domain
VTLTVADRSLTPRDGEQLRTAIYRAGYDTVRLATEVGVTKQYLSLLVACKRRCSLVTAGAIATALDVPIGALFVMPVLSDEENNNIILEDSVLPTAAPANDDPYLLFEEVADLARMPTKTLRHLRFVGQGPEFFKIGQRLRIRESKARAWITSYENPDA